MEPQYLNYLGNQASQVSPYSLPSPPTDAAGNPVAGNGWGAPQTHGGLFGTGQNTLGGAASQALGGGGRNVGQILGGMLGGSGASGAAMGGALAF